MIIFDIICGMHRHEYLNVADISKMIFGNYSIGGVTEITGKYLA